MEAFSIKDELNTLVLKVQKSIGSSNIIKLSLDVQIPEWVSGRMDACAGNIDTICHFLSKQLINGLICIEVIRERQYENQVTLLFEIHGSDARYQVAQTDLPATTPERVQELISKLPVSTESVSDEDKFKFIFRQKFFCIQAAPSAPENSLSGKRILLAEDNEINAMVFTSFLESWDCHVTIAINGVDAVSLVQDNDYDIIIMDIHMPIMNGIQSTQKIRELGFKIPIIALTASTSQHDIWEAVAVGSNDYLQKPVSSNQLFQMINKYV